MKTPWSSQVKVIGKSWGENLLLCLLSALSIISWYVTYRLGLVMSYNDAMSHINLSRLIIDNIQPGVSQIGGVWLPLNHILPLIFVWNNWAWHSGFAGSIFSMLSFVLSTIAIYHTVKEIVSSKLAAFVGAAAFAVNLNILYLQSTPLTEPLYLLFFTLSMLFLVKWMRSKQSSYLLLVGLFGFCQVLTRYDGWFITAVELAVIGLYELFVAREKIETAVGKVLLVALPVGFGIALWLLWNLLIFNNMFFFALGPYSAHAQQSALALSGGLLTKGNLFLSLRAYTYAAVDNVGLYVSLLGIGGTLYFLLFRMSLLGSKKKLLFLIALASPIIFNILALFCGFSILNLPELHWNPSPDPAGQWFNVRYGILALPYIAVMVGLFADWKKLCAVLALVTIIFQQVLFYQQGVITVIDGVKGSSSFQYQDMANAMHSRIKPTDTVLLSTSYFNALSFRSGIDLHQIIHEGVSKEWSLALTTPEHYASWLVMANGDIGEPVYTSLVKNQKNRFLAVYKLVYKGQHASLYHLKDTNELFVTRNGAILTLSSHTFTIRGVNSYDLAYRSEKDITQTFQLLHKNNVNTLRFWLFGDGNSDGFQPKAGSFNEGRFKTVDLIIALARQYNIKLIPVLSNNWTDYGGKAQYLKWVGKEPTDDVSFYTYDAPQNLFKNYINKVITRNNPITHTSYADEPAIMAWEIMNEPRIQPEYANVLLHWTRNMADYIKSLDHTHLVSVGTESVIQNVQDSGTQGICGLPEIDLCSTHLYIYHDNQLLFSSPAEIDTFLSKEAAYAHSYNKPLLMGEVGISKENTPFGQSPVVFLEKLVHTSSTKGYTGYLIWNFSLTPDNSFGFSPAGDGHRDYNLRDINQLMNQ